MPVRIDPASGDLINSDPDALHTVGEVLALNVRCPRCNTRVTVQPRDIDSMESTGPRHFQVGRHEFHCRCFSPEVA
jgi:hypothetical protein